MLKKELVHIENKQTFIPLSDFLYFANRKICSLLLLIAF